MKICSDRYNFKISKAHSQLLRPTILVADLVTATRSATMLKTVSRLICFCSRTLHSLIRVAYFLYGALVVTLRTYVTAPYKLSYYYYYYY